MGCLLLFSQGRYDDDDEISTSWPMIRLPRRSSAQWPKRVPRGGLGCRGAQLGPVHAPGTFLSCRGFIILPCPFSSKPQALFPPTDFTHNPQGIREGPRGRDLPPYFNLRPGGPVQSIQSCWTCKRPARRGTSLPPPGADTEGGSWKKA